MTSAKPATSRSPDRAPVRLRTSPRPDGTQAPGGASRRRARHAPRRSCGGPSAILPVPDWVPRDPPGDPSLHARRRFSDVLLVAGTLTRAAPARAAGPARASSSPVVRATPGGRGPGRGAPSGAVLVDLDLSAGGLEVIERIMAARATPIVVCGAAAEHARGRTRRRRGRRRRRPGRPARLPGVRRRPAPPPAAWPAGSRSSPTHAPGCAARAASRRRRRRTSAAASASAGRRHRRVHRRTARAGHDPRRAARRPATPPSLVVQHMAEGFVEGLARWLDEASPAAGRRRRRRGAAALRAASTSRPPATTCSSRPGYRVGSLEPPAGAVPRARRRRDLPRVAQVLRRRVRRRAAHRHGPRRRRRPARDARRRRVHHRPGRGDERRVGHARRRAGSSTPSTWSSPCPPSRRRSSRPSGASSRTRPGARR